MTVEDVTRWIVLLRRYARALEGNDTCGDAAVVAFTQQLLADPPDRSAGLDRAWLLFREFHDWLLANRQVLAPQAAEQAVAAGDRDIQRRLDRLTPRQRALLLLTTVADLTLAEAADVLRLDAAAAAALLEAAWTEASRSPAALVLVVENEALTAMDIGLQIEALGHRVAAVAPNAQRAWEVVRAQPVDLVISDLSMGGEASGLDLVEELWAATETPIILVTGHPERAAALRSRRRVQVLSKPFDAKALQFAILDALASGSLQRTR